MSRRFSASVLATALITTTITAPHAIAAENNAPKNIIYMVGDGMGYGHVSYTNLYETGQSKYTVDGEFGEVTELAGESVQAYEDFNRLSLTTYPVGGSYDAEQAWASHDYVRNGATDSAAAGTAMASGVKVANRTLGVDPEGNPLKNTSEHAKEMGKAAGVVSSVQFSHATPAAWVAHNENRNNYTAIGAEMVASDMDVIMGAGHPEYDDSNMKLETPAFDYITEEDFNAVKNGKHGWSYLESKDSFEALAAGEVTEGVRYFGLAPVATTLQQAREGEAVAPYSDPRNDVVDLATMTTGALNALNQDEDGFHVKIEGGAIDWTGHANDSAREIEEMQDFNAAVDSAIAWVEENSSWDETLLIVTADHETGYLSGAGEGDRFNAMTGAEGEMGTGHAWYSGDHTNQVVPFFYKGAGSDDIEAAVTGSDPVRGDYIDNTTVADLTMNTWWTKAVDDDTPPADDSSAIADSSEGSSSGPGFWVGLLAAVAAIVAAVAGALNLGSLRQLF